MFREEAHYIQPYHYKTIRHCETGKGKSQLLQGGWIIILAIAANSVSKPHTLQTVSEGARYQAWLHCALHLWPAKLQPKQSFHIWVCDLSPSHQQWDLCWLALAKATLQMMLQSELEKKKMLFYPSRSELHVFEQPPVLCMLLNLERDYCRDYL